MEKKTAVNPSAVGEGRYQLVEVLGRGGSSVVWRAYDEELQRQVAVKVLAGTPVEDPALQVRFHREARHVASLTHSNIVSVYDFGTDRGQSFIVMEYVEGRSLRQILKTSEPLPVPVVAQIATDTLSALGHAHERGIVHRDIKPGNILVTPQGLAKVVDFGIAKSLDETTELTVLGSFVGTATYASPEQFASSQIGPESDLYSLGCVLYHCVAGHPPFEADDVQRLILQHRFADPPSIGSVRSDLPSSMSAAINVALQKDPADRFPNAEAMRRDFASHVANRSHGAGSSILSPDDVVGEYSPVLRNGGWEDDHLTDRHPDTRRWAADVFMDLPMGRSQSRRRRFWVTISLAAIGVLGGIAVGSQLIWSAQANVEAPSQLPSGGFLQSGQSLSSPNDRFTLIMQSDGNLVDYADNRTVPIWATGTSGNFDSYVVMQPDGDLVVYPHGKSCTCAGPADNCSVVIE